MDILDKLFKSEPTPEEQASALMAEFNKPKFSASDKFRLLEGNLQGMDPQAYLAMKNPTDYVAPEGETLAYINDAEKRILENAGASGQMTPQGIPSYAPEDPLKQAAALLNSEAPAGESLAYINQDEAQMLKDAGGAGEPVNSSGIPSFFLNKLFGGGKAPPPMPKLDIKKSARDYVSVMSSPEIQDQLLRNRQKYDPQYQDLQISLAQRAADPMASLAESNAMRAQDFGAQMAERQADSDITMLNRFGADLNQAYRSSDPLMQARVEQANQMASQAFQESQITDLSPEMRRRATQSAREGLVSRGRDMDNVGIAAEAMSREDYLRDIIRDSRQQAQGLGGYASGLNKATSVDPLAMLRGGSNYTQQGYGERAALFGMPQESVTRINPDAGVNIGMQEYANRANYLANTYAAREQAASGMAQGLFTAGGMALGGYLGKG